VNTVGEAAAFALPRLYPMYTCVGVGLLRAFHEGRAPKPQGLIPVPAGFDDPEVMSAVAEVARDPSAIKKYANNPKVRQLALCWSAIACRSLPTA
jgi:hypothetical protein